MSRRGNSIIELIILLVVLGFAIFATQTILFSGSKAEESITDSAIYSKCAVIACDINSREWDKSVFVQSVAGNGIKLCDTDTPNKTLERTGAKRIGDFDRAVFSRSYYDKITLASKIPANKLDLQSATMNAIEEYNGAYLVSEGVRYDVSVSYVDDGSMTSGNRASVKWSVEGGDSKIYTTNLKKITITANKPDGTKVSFAFFASNIGAERLMVK